MFSLGVPFFLIMLGVVSWVKFDSKVTAILISSIIGIGTFYWGMTHFRWSHYLMTSESENTDNTTTDIDLHGFGLPFDWHARPCPAKPTSPGASARMFAEASSSHHSDTEMSWRSRTEAAGTRSNLGDDDGGGNSFQTQEDDFFDVEIDAEASDGSAETRDGRPDKIAARTGRAG